MAEAVRAAIATNPIVEAASAESRASAYELLQLKSEYVPTVSFYADVGRQKVDDPASLKPEDNDATKTSREAGLNFEYVLFDGYRRANLIYSNAARVDASVFSLLDAAETVGLNATEVYIDTVRHLKLQQVAERNVQRHREIGRRVTELVDAGRLPLSDQLQAEDRVRAAELALVEVRRAGRDADARYERVIGHSRKGPVSIQQARGMPRNLESLVATAVENSHRVIVANIEVDRVEYERGVANADRQAQVSINAGVRQGVDIDGVTGTESDAFIGLSLRWQLVGGGRDERDRALIERKSKALSMRHVAVREVRELAARSWNSYLSNAERARILTDQLRANEELVTQFNDEFEAGKRTLLDLLETERAKFDVEFEKVSADASLAFSTYRVLAAQSKLAEYFGAKPKGTVFDPNFEERARREPTFIFKTQIPDLK